MLKAMNGLLLIDKPIGWTSFDVVNKVRRTVEVSGLYQDRKKRFPVGHTGTLDPLATGLLVILVGNYTKRAPELTKLDKTYQVNIKLGKTSTTGDAEGIITPTSNFDNFRRSSKIVYDVTGVKKMFKGKISPSVTLSYKDRPSNSLTKTPGSLRRQTLYVSGEASPHESSSGAQFSPAPYLDTNGENDSMSVQIPSLETVEAVLKQFIGVIHQTPPRFSAIKVDGQRAYKLARAGKKVKLEPRKVKIYEILNVAYTYPQVKFTAKVSSGTYIRSLAEDIGEKLGTGAYLETLKRTQIGKFQYKDAIQPNNLSLEHIKKHIRTNL